MKKCIRQHVLLVTLALTACATALANVGASGKTVVAHTDAPLVIVGYENTAVKTPGKYVHTKNELYNALNFHIDKMKTRFTIKVAGTHAPALPRELHELTAKFVSQIDIRQQSKSYGAFLEGEIHYNDAGKVVQTVRCGKPLGKSDQKALEIKSQSTRILNAVKGKNDYEKIVYFHDYIVSHCENVNSNTEGIGDNAYGVLLQGKSSNIGYAEAMQLLLTLSEIENDVVFAKSKVAKIEQGVYWFNRVKLDGEWYNISVSGDDPRSGSIAAGISRGYLLVNDEVMQQEYTWEEGRYPAATSGENWYLREGLDVNSQDALEAALRKSLRQRQTFVTVWIPDYAKEKYSFSFLQDIPGIEAKITLSNRSYLNSASYHTAVCVTIRYSQKNLTEM